MQEKQQIFPPEPSAVASSALLGCVLLFYICALLKTVSTVVLPPEERAGKKTNESFSEQLDLNVVVKFDA